MTSADSSDTHGSALEEHLSFIDDLLARPFPAESYGDNVAYSGPGHHLLVLRASPDFWDDSDGEASRAADTDLQAHLDALITTLTSRWGEPETVDLWQYLRASFEGISVPEPINSLCQLAGSLQIWQRPEIDRWMGLTIGQGDKELPLELLAAVGRATALRPPAAGKP
jgi:hypothetical protein